MHVLCFGITVNNTCCFVPSCSRNPKSSPPVPQYMAPPLVFFKSWIPGTTLQRLKQLVSSSGHTWRISKLRIPFFGLRHSWQSRSKQANRIFVLKGKKQKFPRGIYVSHPSYEPTRVEVMYVKSQTALFPKLAITHYILTYLLVYVGRC